MRTMYAVVADEGFIQDAVALFDDETQAEEYATKLSSDPDFDGCDYAVATVTIDENSIHEQQPVE